ncbi:excisionase family DNA-binding protein [Rubrivirga sp.]|uniref:excisionase family DNA-binding protein n=1 Tax=Rubrivirga sp. TaxID=1885344 RepID=UPI003B520F23
MNPKRLQPSDFTDDEIVQLSRVFARPGHVRVIDDEGHEAELPEAMLGFLGHMLRQMEQRRIITLMPHDEQFTTQAAADYLGMSRQHLVNLLEAGEIPFTRVGTHRRVVFQDLRDFEKRRDAERTRALDDLAREVDDAGLYDASYTGDG